MQAQQCGARWQDSSADQIEDFVPFEACRCWRGPAPAGEPGDASVRRQASPSSLRVGGIARRTPPERQRIRRAAGVARRNSLQPSATESIRSNIHVAVRAGRLALSHQPFLLLITCLTGGLRFNKFNGLDSWRDVARGPLLARCDNAPPAPFRGPARRRRRPAPAFAIRAGPDRRAAHARPPRLPRPCS